MCEGLCICVCDFQSALISVLKPSLDVKLQIFLETLGQKFHIECSVCHPQNWTVACRKRWKIIFYITELRIFHFKWKIWEPLFFLEGQENTLFYRWTPRSKASLFSIWAFFCCLLAVTPVFSGHSSIIYTIKRLTRILLCLFLQAQKSWIERAFSKRECVHIIVSAKDPHRWVRMWNLNALYNSVYIWIKLSLIAAGIFCFVEKKRQRYFWSIV